MALLTPPVPSNSALIGDVGSSGRRLSLKPIQSVLYPLPRLTTLTAPIVLATGSIAFKYGSIASLYG